MTALISVIPILLLIVLMMGFKVSGYKSAVVTLVVTILLALFAVPSMGILPEKYAGVSIYGITLWSVVEGVLKACFPILLASERLWLSLLPSSSDWDSSPCSPL